MEKLTIEKKAKRYDEAIERAESIYNEIASSSAPTKGIFTYIFPELKESEDVDKKIREEIIATIHLYYGKPLEDEAKEMIAWLEKQGEHKSFDYENTTIVPKDFAPKAKPKFKVGDWVVFNNRHISVYQVEKIENYEYTLRHFLGGSMLLSFSHEDMIRAWTIQDAKGGDVLNSPSHRLIWIYKDKEHYYACVNMNYVTKNVATDGLISIPNDVCPATKDERTILFEKMKESEYEWDAEKKELKKVEQLKLTEFEDAVKDMMDDYRDAIDDNDATVEEVKERAAYLLSLIPHKPAKWGKEDEKIVTGIINDIQERLEDYPTEQLAERYFKEIKWLKSLKERYGWKPSDGQLHDLKRAIDSFTFEPDYLEELYEDLKKLKGG